MNVTDGASATTSLTKRQQLKEGIEYGQILPTAEVTMKSDEPWRPETRATKRAAAGGRPGAGADPPNSGAHSDT